MVVEAIEMSEETTRQSTIDLLLVITSEIGDDGMTVGDLVERLSDRGFGIVQLVLALPVCIPFLYGIPQAVAVPMIFIALQIAAGRHSLWLPEYARQRKISKEGLTSIAERSKKYVSWFENISRPRLVWLTHGAPERVFGVFMTIFCASILVPLPATNTIPGIGVAIMSIGFLERDGILVVLGTLIGAIWVGLLLFFATTLGLEGLELLKSYV